MNIDSSRAKNLSGVKAVISANDVNPRLVGASLKDMPVLARDRPVLSAKKSPRSRAAGIGIVAPAVANAVYNATGVRISELPITAEKIINGLSSHPPLRGGFYKRGL